MALINPQPGSSSIYDPTLPSRIVQGASVPQQSPDTIASIDPGQGPQYNPPFGADASPQTSTPTSPIATQLGHAAGRQMPFPGQVDPRGVFAPTFSPAAPAANNMPFPGQRDPRGVFAPRPRVVARPAVATGRGTVGAGGGLNLTDDTFKGLTDEMIMGEGGSAGGNVKQTAQTPAPATPQGWNLFAALGQALSHLLGYNALGQPQGMTGLVRTPPQTGPAQTAALRMPTAPIASRYMGRTFIG